MTRGKRLRGDDLRVAMIDAAEEIIVTEGLKALTARRLAGEMGIAVGTTYNVFENLFELVAEVNARSLGMLAAKIAEINVGSMTARDALIAVAGRYLEFVRDNRNRWLAIFEVDMPDAVGSLPNQRYIDALFGVIENILMRDDRKVSSKTARLSARGLWAAMHGLLMLSESNRLTAIGLPTVGETIEHLIDCHLRGLDVQLDKS